MKRTCAPCHGVVVTTIGTHVAIANELDGMQDYVIAQEKNNDTRANIYSRATYLPSARDLLETHFSLKAITVRGRQIWCSATAGGVYCCNQNYCSVCCEAIVQTNKPYYLGIVYCCSLRRFRMCCESKNDSRALPYNTGKHQQVRRTSFASTASSSMTTESSKNAWARLEPGPVASMHCATSSDVRSSPRTGPASTPSRSYTSVAMRCARGEQ